MLKWTKESEKLQTHIINGKVVQNKFLNPMHSDKNKDKLIVYLKKIFGTEAIEVLDNNCKYFKITLQNKVRYFSIDTPDHGGTENGKFKFEIPFANKTFVNLLRNDELITISNIYFPLLEDDKGVLSIDEDNIIIFLMNPIQIFSSDVYTTIKNGGKGNPSSRWISMQNIIDAFNSNNNGIYVSPNRAKVNENFDDYSYLIKLKYLNEDKLFSFENMSIEKLLNRLGDLNNRKESTNSYDFDNLYQICQNNFRSYLLRQYDHSCAIEGCGVTESNLLIASHVKPRSHIKKENSDNLRIRVEELENPKNGILLCRKHDAVFDKGYISFDNDLKVIWTKKYERTVLEFVDSRDKLIQKNSVEIKYLEYHRKHIFLK